MNTAEQNSLSPCAYSCIQAAKDWLSTESWKNISRNLQDDAKNTPGTSTCQNSNLYESVCKDGDTSGTRTLIAEINAGGWTGKNTVPVVIDEEEEDRKEKEYVREATEEACLVSASVLRRRFNKYATRSSSDISVAKVGEYRNGSTVSAPVSCKTKGPGGGGGKVIGNDDLDASYVLEERIQREAALSARGVWLYTVGLVGKPSAGIFYLIRLRLRLRSVVNGVVKFTTLFTLF